MMDDCWGLPENGRVWSEKRCATQNREAQACEGGLGSTMEPQTCKGSLNPGMSPALLEK